MSSKFIWKVFPLSEDEIRKYSLEKHNIHRWNGGYHNLTWDEDYSQISKDQGSNFAEQHACSRFGKPPSCFDSGDKGINIYMETGVNTSSNLTVEEIVSNGVKDFYSPTSIFKWEDYSPLQYRLFPIFLL